jgi:ribosomal protein S18 acetylase RimI-like enzyme
MDQVYQTKILSGEEIRKFLPEVAALRIKVFREYPYLYEGNNEYEKKYLERYAKSPTSIIVVAENLQGAIIGASTGNAMENEMSEVAKPFVAAGYDLNGIYYFAESVLLPEYRGMGIGKEFMQARLRKAKQLGKKYAAFCSVVREGHNAPYGYNSPEHLWKKQGFVKHPELVSYFSWKDIGDEVETRKPLVYWLKEI